VDTPDELLTRLPAATAASIKSVKFISDEQHAIFAHELQNGTEVDGGFCEHLL